VPLVGATNVAQDSPGARTSPSRQAIAALVEGATIQDPLVRHRQALGWGQQVCTQLLQSWSALEAYEALAYEDKVAEQLHVLDGATKSLR
jgi:hypothetical protein